MSLRSAYEKFLGSPSPLSLSENASLSYIPTLTTFTKSEPIVRHLESQNRNVVKKKSQNIIDVVEGHAAIVMEVETTLEFTSGGGSYLPGLENFVVDKIATFPVTHTVYFDGQDKIRLIRLAWDQGSLLSQVEVIGSRGKNWPISDGKAQARLVSSTSTPPPTMASAPPMSPRGRESHASPAPARSMSPNKKHIKDPYTSLDLFEEQKENRRELHPAPIAPRASAKPPPREMSELFAAGHEDYEPSQHNGGSPKKVVKNTAIAPKGAGSQKFLPSRLFEEESAVKSPVGYKSNPAKYNHFDLGEADENDPLQFKTSNNGNGPTSAIPMRPKTTKHLSQWDFADSVTPEKVTQKIRAGNVRNHSWSDDEGATEETPGKHQTSPKARRDAETHFEFLDDGTPVARQRAIPKSRPDAETHFNFQDDGTPSDKRPTSRGVAHNKGGLGLYANHLYDDGTNEFDDPDEKKPLKTITNTVGRSNDFGAHWDMTDPSPPSGKPNNENKPLVGDRMNAHKRMDSQWDTYDESPEQTKKPGGGNMKKGLESHWGFDGDGGENVRATKAGPKKAHPGLWDF